MAPLGWASASGRIDFPRQPTIGRRHGLFQFRLDGVPMIRLSRQNQKNDGNSQIWEPRCEPARIAGAHRGAAPGSTISPCQHHTSTPSRATGPRPSSCPATRNAPSTSPRPSCRTPAASPTCATSGATRARTRAGPSRSWRTAWACPVASIYATELVREYGVKTLIRVGHGRAGGRSASWDDCAISATAHDTTPSVYRVRRAARRGAGRLRDHPRGVAAARRRRAAVHVGNVVLVERLLQPGHGDVRA